MNFPTVNEAGCPEDVPGRGGTGGDVESLLIKPEVMIQCVASGDQQFKAFLKTDNGGETEVTSGLTWTSSNPSIISINASSGLATLLAAGIATITATYTTFTAYAQVEVIADGECCEPLVIAQLVAIDNSESMSEATGGMTRLTFAKAAAKAFFADLRWDKDTGGLMRFNTAGTVVRAIGSTQVSDAIVDGIPQSTRQTDLLKALQDAIAVLGNATADRKVLVLMSDGEHRPFANGTIPYPDEIIAAANEFKSAGGIIVCLGCAASADGFANLQAIASGGLFINAWTAAGYADALENLVKFMCYFCGAQPPAYANCLDEPLPIQTPKPTALDDPELV